MNKHQYPSAGFQIFLTFSSLIFWGNTAGAMMDPPPGGEKTVFRISAYYSPLPDQERYFQGSYADEIRLNGNGTHGADGTPVFSGMLAAPKNYPFGTKIFLPGLGVGEVRDRGGAIVKAGERGQAYDRIDIWMGEGLEGLSRALSWGKKNLEAIIWLPSDPNVPETHFSFSDIPFASLANIALPSPSTASSPPVPSSHLTSLFSSGISKGFSDPSVTSLQRFLLAHSFLSGPITGKFDEVTEKAVFSFQKTQKILEKESDAGAGVFGPKTQKALFAILYDREQTLQKKNPSTLAALSISGEPREKKKEPSVKEKEQQPILLPDMPAEMTISALPRAPSGILGISY